MLRRGLLPLLLVLAVLAAGCGGSAGPDSATPTPSRPPAATSSLAYTGSDAGFYRVPSPVPSGRHGALVRYQDLGGGDYRVLYRSTSVQGKPIVVTGRVRVPAAAGDDRIVLTWAHGTVGLADSCAPSKEEAFPLPVDVSDRGWILAATDYEGLGTPGLHPYLAGISEGRATLDIVRAAKELPGSGAGDRTIIWGHSQGGHAALFAGQLAPEWTPELDVLGTVAGSPATELPLLAAALQGGGQQGFMAMVAGGLHAAYPRAALDEILTPKGVAGLGVLGRECIGGVLEHYARVSYDDFAKADPASVEPWKSILRENDPGHVVSPSPLLIVHGEADQTIPAVASKFLFDRLCGLGQVVERRTYPDRGHVDVVAASLGDMLTWMDARAAGTPAPTGCPAG